MFSRKTVMSFAPAMMQAGDALLQRWHGFGDGNIVDVAAEMTAVNSGLGFLIVDARNAGNRYDLVVAGMLIIGTIGLLLDLGMRSFQFDYAED